MMTGDTSESRTSGNATELGREINDRLERVKEADEKTTGRENPSRVVYCPRCDEYAVGDEQLSCDFKIGVSNDVHADSHVVGDYEETSIVGYIQALEWVSEKLGTGFGTPQRAGRGTTAAVMCRHCSATWDAESLYKTGDVLRCPNCDGVMRP